jgi:hypothetical protein
MGAAHDGVSEFGTTLLQQHLDVGAVLLDKMCRDINAHWGNPRKSVSK